VYFWVLHGRFRLATDMKLQTILIFLLSFQCLAADKSIHFSVVPNDCIVKNKSETCQADVLISWEMALAQDVCLYQEHKLLRCIAAKKHGDIAINLEASANTAVNFSLLNAVDGSVLYKQSFKVNVLEEFPYKPRKLPWRLTQLF
jgi:hypothetical protein